MNISAILAGISTLEKFLPVVEAVGKEIGPLVQTEIKDGKVLWADVLNCFDDFKKAVLALKTQTPLVSPEIPAKWRGHEVNSKAGDVLLFRVSSSSNTLDRLIAWGQRIIHESPTTADYCHVALVGPDPEHMYEAKWPRIHNVPIDLGALQKNIILETYRNRNLTPEQIGLLMNYAQKHVGQRYDLLALLTLGYVQLGRTAVCSEFVWRAFTSAGVLLCPWSALESPDDIAASALLEKVT
jgi:hypothetical protein